MLGKPHITDIMGIYSVICICIYRVMLTSFFNNDKFLDGELSIENVDSWGISGDIYIYM